jgi:hypothetical protein
MSQFLSKTLWEPYVRHNETNWMFNTVAGVWDAVVMHKLISHSLKRSCSLCSLLPYRLGHLSKHAVVSWHKQCVFLPADIPDDLCQIVTKSACIFLLIQHEITENNLLFPKIVYLHPVAHRYFTFTFLVQCLCGLSMFKTLYSVFNTCHFIKSLNIACFGRNWPSSSVKNCLIKKLLLFYSVMLVRPCLPCACSLLFSCLLVTQQQKTTRNRHTEDRGTKKHDWIE